MRERRSGWREDGGAQWNVREAAVGRRCREQEEASAGCAAEVVEAIEAARREVRATEGGREKELLARGGKAGMLFWIFLSFSLSFSALALLLLLNLLRVNLENSAFIAVHREQQQQQQWRRPFIQDCVTR